MYGYGTTEQGNYFYFPRQQVFLLFICFFPCFPLLFIFFFHGWIPNEICGNADKWRMWEGGVWWDTPLATSLVGDRRKPMKFGLKGRFWFTFHVSLSAWCSLLISMETVLLTYGLVKITITVDNQPSCFAGILTNPHVNSTISIEVNGEHHVKTASIKCVPETGLLHY